MAEVIPPIEITHAMLTSATAAEPGVGEAAYNNGSTYALGDKVILGAPSSNVTISNASPGVVTWNTNGLPDGTPVVLTTTGTLPAGLTTGVEYFVVNRAANTFQLAAEPDGAPIVTTTNGTGTHTATARLHRRYESQAGSNTGHPPAIDDGTNWIDIGPTNKWAAYDLLRNTGTVTASPQVHTITPGRRIDAVAAVGLVADSITVEVSRSAVVVYSHTQTLRERNTQTWYEYFFGEFEQQDAIALFDLPPYADGVLTVTLTRSNGDVTCGGLILGQSIYLGEAEQPAESDALNFSTVDRDPFGNSLLNRRRSVPKATMSIVADKARVRRLLKLRDELNAAPALWSGLDDAEHGYFEAVLILGFYKRFLIGLDQPDHVTIQLELEEV